MGLGDSPLRQPYLHNKTGRRYTVLAIGTDCTNSRDGVAVMIYAPNDCPFSVCVREVAEFEAKFSPAPPYAG